MIEPSVAATCLVCGGALSENVVECTKCATPHLLACREYTNRCAVFGCGCDVGRTRRPAPAEKARPPERGRGVIVAVATAVFLVAGGAVAVVTVGCAESLRRQEPASVTIKRAGDDIARADASVARVTESAERQVGEPSETVADIHVQPVSAVSGSLRALMPRVRVCYERALGRARPGLAGRYDVRLSIHKTGIVQSVVFRTDTVGDPAMAACIKRTLMGVRAEGLARRGERSTVDFPLLFRAAR